MSQSKEVRTMVSNLEKFRHQKGYSQTEFAEMIGMPRSSYCKLINGETSSITVDALYGIYKVTGCLCYQLMEILSDDYLTTCDLIRGLSAHEKKYMLQFVRVYLEAKRRM